jgi:hypothetical protein
MGGYHGRHRARRGRRSLRRALVLLVGLAGALLGAGTAMAYWTTTGNGTGTTVSTTALALTLTPGTPTAQLYPGGSADVVLSIVNPNPFTVHVGSLALDTSQGTGGFAVDAGHSGCVLSVLSLTTQTNSGAGWTAPARVDSVNGNLAVTLPGALAMGTTAASACQDASFTVYLATGP